MPSDDKTEQATPRKREEARKKGQVARSAEINAAFGDFASFQAQVKDAAVKRFGSGWSWLVLADGKLKVLSTANQDSPYMQNQIPLLGIDVC